MKVLSLTQPWATLVATGAKKIETRAWQPTSYRHGPLAIHATREIAYGVLDLEPYKTALAGRDLPTGVILAVCDLVEVVRITAANAPGEPELSFGDFTPGRYAWRLANVRRLAVPIPARGNIGLWEFAMPDGLELVEVTT